MVAARASFVILGGTGDGKTTLFNALLGLCPRDERLVVIEDTREVRLPQPNVVHLETREFVPEGAKVITQYDLVENALRMFPTRLLLGEVRRGEVLLAWLRAARSGHPGSGFTFHATTMDDFLESATQELQLAMPSLDAETAARRLGGAIHVAIRYGRHPEVDGHFVQEIAALSLDEQRRVQVTTLYRLAERTAGHLVLESTGAPPPWLSPEGYLLF
jgi:pilus assembly protein CpaF